MSRDETKWEKLKRNMSEGWLSEAEEEDINSLKKEFERMKNEISSLKETIGQLNLKLDRWVRGRLEGKNIPKRATPGFKIRSKISTQMQL